MRPNKTDQSPVEPPERDRCYVCNRSKATCFCGFVTPFDTNTRFVLLMHPKEFKEQTTGSGRLTHRALKNSEILMGVDFTDDKRLNSLLNDPAYYSVVVYPGRKSVNISECETSIFPPDKKLLVILLDGTWRHAKRIKKMSPNLHTIPEIGFTPPALSRFYIKRQPAPVCVSTIEATYYLLGILEKFGIEKLDDKHATLLNAIDSIVNFQVEYISSPDSLSRHVINKQTWKK